MLHRAVFLFIAVVLVWASSNINWEQRRAGRIINVDGNGYYAYLPAVFIYNDLSFGFFDEINEKYSPSNFDFDYRNEWEGSVINKFYAGTAFAQLPFFLLADLATSFSSFDRDGYSYFYLLSINVSSIFYLLLALFMLDRYLKEEKIKRWVRSFLFLVTVFGTNIFYYTVYEPSMSHVYSLAFVSAFLYSIRRYGNTLHKPLLILAGFSLAVVILIRPVNGLLILSVPFLLAGTETNVFKVFRDDWKWLIAAMPVFLAVIFIQLLIYKIQTDSFFIYSYGEDYFDFANSQFFKFLISYRKGLWVYTPVTFIAIAGFIFLWRQSSGRAMMLVLFLVFVIYVLASWHQWWYGGSFSSRVMVEYMPFFILLLGIMLSHIKKRILLWIAVITLILLSILNLIQTHQYYAGIIHWMDMDKEYYWEVFLRFKNPGG